MDKLIKKLLREGLLDEDYPISFNRDEFKTLTSYRARVEYCKERLTRLGAGSSRIVYQIDDEKVLKLAKNRKGLAQNYEEFSISDGDNHEDIVAKVLDHHPDDLWVEMELARKVRESDFSDILGFKLGDIFMYLKNHEALSRGDDRPHRLGEELSDMLDECEFIWDIMKIMDWNSVPAGDFGRVSSYGKVKRNGEDKIVLIDYGLTDSVAQTYYSI